MSNNLKFLLRNTYANLNSPFFIKGNDIPRYIKENHHKMTDIISIIDPNLNNIYWNNRDQLSITDLDNLNDYMKEPIIEFSIVNDEDDKLIPYYQLNNNNIEFNLLYISVGDFVKAINNNNPIKIKLPKLNIYVEYTYELYDLYNLLTHKIDNVISR
jgi:hypothetical protein